MSLRTKFLCSLVLITAGLTCATLLVARRTAQVQLQREVEENGRNAILSFQVMQHQRQTSLDQKADLLATLARIRNGEASTIRDSSEDPWQSNDCNLFALADRKDKIVALHTTTADFPIATAEEMLHRSLNLHATEGWWYSGRRLYQVVLKPIYDGEPLKKTALGTVVVGREIDARDANDLRAISSTHIVLRYGNEIVVNTFSPIQEIELTQQVHDWATPRRIQIGHELFWASSSELAPGAHPGVGLTVLKSYSNAMALLARLNRLLLGLGLVAVLAGGTLVYVISDAFTRPLASLALGVHALEQGDFAYPLESDGGDEVAQVTRAFDRMRNALQRNEAKRRQLEDQLRHSQRMEAMGRLAGGIAHDFNNLLTVIKGHSSIMIDRLKSADPVYASSQQIAKASDRAASLTRQLLAFSRMQVLQPKVLDLNALITDMEKLLARLIREDITFAFKPGVVLGRVKADTGQIEQVILNLVVNACDAMPSGGELTIETENVTVSQEVSQARSPMLPGQYVLLTVTDTGQGMDADTKSRIFEPFFTTKELGKGTGLGLATVYGIVKQSGGCIWVDSEPGRGTQFEVYLSRVNEPLESSMTEQNGAGPGRDCKTVLIAEDEDAVRELASEFLKAAGYTVFTAEDGAEALAMGNRSGEPIHLILTDVVMPNMRGPELAKRLKSLRPDMKVVYMSGYLEYDRDNGEFLGDGFFLQKPFSREGLVNKVGEALRNGRKKKPVAQSV